MRRRVLARLLVAAWMGAAAMACNAILGNHDRTLEEADDGDGTVHPTEAGGGKETGGPETSTPDGGGTDAPSDAPKPITIPVNMTVADFTSPNGALFRLADGGGIEIYGTTGAGHAVIVPKTQPKIGGDDYTLEAVGRAPSNVEFGILMRMQPDASTALVGSSYGQTNDPFIATMGPPDWSPLKFIEVAKVDWSPTARYHLKMVARGSILTASLWYEPNTEPAIPQMMASPPGFAKGSGIGFYMYYLGDDIVVEKLIVTVP